MFGREKREFTLYTKPIRWLLQWWWWWWSQEIAMTTDSAATSEGREWEATTMMTMKNSFLWMLFFRLFFIGKNLHFSKAQINKIVAPTSQHKLFGRLLCSVFLLISRIIFSAGFASPRIHPRLLSLRHPFGVVGRSIMPCVVRYTRMLSMVGEWSCFRRRKQHQKENRKRRENSFSLDYISLYSFFSFIVRCRIPFVGWFCLFMKSINRQDGPHLSLTARLSRGSPIFKPKHKIIFDNISWLFIYT